MLGATELGYVDGSRPAPVLLEHEIGDHPGPERERHQHQHDGAARDQQRPLRADELDHECNDGGHGNERDQPGGGVTCPQIGRIVGAPKSPAFRVEEQAGELEVEIGPEAEDNSDYGGNGERDHEAGSVHGFDPPAGLAEVPDEFKSDAGSGAAAENRDKSGSLRRQCPHLASDFKFMQRC